MYFCSSGGAPLPVLTFAKATSATIRMAMPAPAMSSVFELVFLGAGALAAAGAFLGAGAFLLDACAACCFFFVIPEPPTDRVDLRSGDEQARSQHRRSASRWCVWSYSRLTASSPG